MDGADTLHVGVLGPLGVRRAGAPLALTSTTQRLILARLAVADGPVPEDQLADAIWGERPPASATTSLRAQISRLRAALRGEPSSSVLVHGPGGYRLEGPVERDHVRFEEHLAAARAAGDDPDAVREQLALGLGLWRGDVLAEFRYEPFAQPTIARLEALRLAALEQRIGLDVRGGRADRVVPELEALSREHPLRERLAELLMTALGREDRTAEALAVYRRFEETQRRELGLEPSARLQTLHGALLRGDAPDGHEPGRRAPTEEDTSDDATMTAAWRAVVGTVDLPTVSDPVRLDLLLARGDGLRNAGRTEEARQTYAAAAQLATRLDRPDQLAAAVLGMVGPPEDSLSGVPLDEGLVERALLRLPGDHPAMPRLQARLAVGLIDRGEPVRGEALLGTALAAAREAGDRVGVAYVLRARHRTWFDPHALDERLASAEELLQLGRALASPDVRSWGHRWCVIAHLESGATDEVDRHLAALDELAETHSDAFHRWFVVVRRAGVALIREPAAAASRAAVLEAVALTDRMPSPYTTSTAMLLLWACHLLQGRNDEAMHLAEQLAASQPAVAPLVAWSAVRAGHPDRAREVLDGLTLDGPASLLSEDRIRVLWLVNLAALAETACALGDRDRGALVRERLRPLAGRAVVVPPGVTVVGTVDDTLARLDALLG